MNKQDLMDRITHLQDYRSQLECNVYPESYNEARNTALNALDDLIYDLMLKLKGGTS